MRRLDLASEFIPRYRIKPIQQSRTRRQEFGVSLLKFHVACPVIPDVDNPHEMKHFEVGGDCFIAPATNGKLNCAATSSYDSSSPTLKLRLGRNQKPKRVRPAPGPLEQKI